jgi:hypothetical protein
MQSQGVQGVAQELGCPIDAVGVARAQPLTPDHLGLGQGRYQRPMTGLGAISGLAHRDAFLMAVLVEERPRVHVEGVASLVGGELAQLGGSALGGDAEESAEDGLAWNGLDAENLSHGWAGG